MEWGPHEEMLIRRRAKGRPTPPLDRKPALTEDMTLAWDMFATLHAQRGRVSLIAPAPGGGMVISLEPCAIRMQDVKALLDIYDIGGEVARELVDFIAKMDGAYRAWESVRNRSKKEK